MQDKSINNALTALRKQIVRENLDGLEHVDALMRLRGVPVPPIPPKAAQLRSARPMVLDALRDGPKTTQEIATIYAARCPYLTDGAAYNVAIECLQRMRFAKLLISNGKFWSRPTDGR